MYRALLLDFYGTLVAEDDVLVTRISERIAAASERGAFAGEISGCWHRHFARLCADAHVARFRTQRELELESLAETARIYDAAVDIAELAGEMFAYWAAPAPLEGAAEFLREYAAPICIVSNIDSADLEAAIGGLGWEFTHLVTSESCRAYKPRPEMFRTALSALGCAPSEVIHVGDSLRSDVAGAAVLGIDAAWVNAADRALPGSLELRPRHSIRSVVDLLPLLSEADRHRV